jgi:hypothetical protein
MILPSKLYNIEFKDIKQGMVIYTDDTENGIGICGFEVLTKPTVEKEIGTLHCVNLETSVEQDILVNISRGRDIFTAKLQSGWKKI